MKRVFQGIAVLAVLMAAYCIWPLIGLNQIADAVERKDAASLSERLDRAALKRSLVDQIGRTYLTLSGKDRGLSPRQIELALYLAATLASPRIDKLLEPEALIALLEEGGTESYAKVGRIGMPKLEGPNFRNLFRVVRNTEYAGRDFYVTLPLTAEEQTGYRIRLTLRNWTWKLSGVGLPPDVQMRIAREIINQVG